MGKGSTLNTWLDRVFVDDAVLLTSQPKVLRKFFYGCMKSFCIITINEGFY
jgi:hypothetical protein